MNKKWQYNDNCNKQEVQKLQEKLNINKLLATILVNRNITIKNADKFLNPNRNSFYNPFEMPDMENAVERIIYAIDKKEKIIIFGDYDVDGITSTTVLKKFFQDRGIYVGTYIPNRLNEGYGLNKCAIKKIAKEGYTLMITVDCGITAVDEVNLAKELGIDTIVTDHHEPKEVLPDAIAVVDCKRKDSTYPFKELAGVGVAFKLIQAISIRLKIDEIEYLKYLDIAAIGTISDIVPLVDENRVITLLGLKLVKCTKNIGLKSLINVINYKQINSNAIAFGIAPRINACGRMGFANTALDLLLTNSKENADTLTYKINSYNFQRQSEEKKIYDDAIKQIEHMGIENEETIVLKGENWHNGVIGIVSSKITEKYYKPSILICFRDNENIGKGSGRSIEGFNLHEALTKCSDTLNTFGGHSMAVGITIEKSKFDIFKNKINQIAIENNIQELMPAISIDENVNIDEIDKEMVQSLSLLEPFGNSNEMPIFSFKNLKINSIRSLSEGKHLRLTLKSSKNTYVNCIGFNLGFLSSEYKIGDKIDVVGNLEINSFNGTDSIQINIKDVKKAI